MLHRLDFIKILLNTAATFHLLPSARAKGNSKMTVIVYNTQKNKQGDEYVRSLFDKADYVCLSRVAQKFVENCGKPYVYQPLFKGNKYGTAIIGKEKMQSSTFSPLSKVYENDTQGSSCTIVKTPMGDLVNTLGPYEELPQTPAKDHADHIKTVFKKFSAAIIVGDFHGEMGRLKELGVLSDKFKNHTKAVNFWDPENRQLNLTKCFSDLNIEVQESILEVPDKIPGTHFPVLLKISKPG